MTPDQLLTLAGIVGAALASVMLLIGTRGKTRSDAKSALDARIDARVEKQLAGAWAEIDTLKRQVETLEQQDQRKTSAMARILRAIAGQWPDAHGPNLDPDDIAEIEETIPPQWIRRGARPTT
jgi:uncharacterized membrane protein